LGYLILLDDLDDILVRQWMFLADALRIVLDRGSPYNSTKREISQTNYIASVYFLKLDMIPLWMELQKSSIVDLARLRTTGAV